VAFKKGGITTEHLSPDLMQVNFTLFTVPRVLVLARMAELCRERMAT
jgi:hypothetical protein